MSDQTSKPLPLNRNRRFVSLFAAETISGFGDRLHVFALLILVHQLTGKAVDLGLLAIVQVLPATFLAPFSGWILDRVDRRRMMVAMDLFQAGLVLLIPLVDSLTEILVIAALLALARQFAEPARMAVLPGIVHKDQLVTANGISMSTAHLLLIVGPAAAGVLIARYGSTVCFQVDAVTYALSSLCLIGLGPCKPLAAEKLASGRDAVGQFFGEVREGLAVLLGDPVLRFAIAFFALITFVSSMQQPLVVIFVKDVLGAGDVGLGMLVSMAGIGGILGSGLAVISQRWIGSLKIIPLATLLDGLALVAFALMVTLPPAMALFGFFGLVGGLLQVRVVSLFQARVPEHARGRAFGWLGPIFGPLGVISLAVGTILADRVGVVPVIAGSGVLEAAVALLAGLWLLTRPALVTADDGGG